MDVRQRAPFEGGHLDAFGVTQTGGRAPLFDKIFAGIAGVGTTQTGLDFLHTTSTTQAFLANNNVGGLADSGTLDDINELRDMYMRAERHPAASCFPSRKVGTSVAWASGLCTKLKCGLPVRVRDERLCQALENLHHPLNRLRRIS